MSGHSKWSQIKRKKGVEDAKKSAEFGKFSRLITLESKRAQGNVNSPGLRQVIERAKAINMPSSNIERAVQRGLEKEASLLQEVVYEAYGPGGSALMVSGLTDNKNRTAGELRHLLLEHGATLAVEGGASWAFSKQGAAWIPTQKIPLSEEDKKGLAEIIEELEAHEDVQRVYTNAN